MCLAVEIANQNTQSIIRISRASPGARMKPIFAKQRKFLLVLGSVYRYQKKGREQKSVIQKSRNVKTTLKRQNLCGVYHRKGDSTVKRKKHTLALVHYAEASKTHEKPRNFLTTNQPAMPYQNRNRLFWSPAHCNHDCGDIRKKASIKKIGQSRKVAKKERKSSEGVECSEVRVRHQLLLGWSRLESCSQRQAGRAWRRVLRR